MSRRPPRLCSCGSIVSHGARCQCQREQDRVRGARHDRARPNARQRGYDRQWEEVARTYLRQPGNQRCECGAPATLVRHRISIRQHPELRMSPANWRPGCRRCNALDYIRERTPRR
ncbi:endonuclease [Bosea beijingensis]|uniref:endonuclease n=1 Tax=Bosea beijingensis TaxID=3068632 RepID=UPI00274147DD|nr:endonuclease [Bosea sp. REN20]